MNPLPRLYAVADGSFGDPVEIARALFAGGARLVQVRHKAAPTLELFSAVAGVLANAPEGARVIVNDRPDVALLTGAAGVHVGRQDLSPSLVRRSLTAGQWIGYSTHNLSQALEADRMPVDYIAAGPVFPTSTKKDADPVLGLEGLRAICSHVTKPVVAIGGITLDAAREVFACGAASVAVIGDLLRYPDVTSRTRQWLREAGQ